MPTAAKLTAAILFALMTIVASEQFKAYMPEGYQFGYFLWINAAIAAPIAWKLIGGRVGNGVASAINNGVTALLALVVVLLFNHSFRLMILESTGIGYANLTAALQDVASKMIEHGLLLLNTDILVTFGIGTFVTAILAEAASRRWR
ncbi:TrgA family protein [Cognatishimia sp.]|uniref:TrgA family protein n=1 Tax=Cognatishimia sp. TaxID=2211648 RepID=UPI0035169AB0